MAFDHILGEERGWGRPFEEVFEVMKAFESL
jgi:hypothetical protein